MTNITIRQATESDICILESILFDAVNWLGEMGQPLWKANEVTWEALSENYLIGDFYIAYLDEIPSGCMALVDYDPFFWPDVKRGDSLFVHKLAVIKPARKSGVADALMNFFKVQGAKRGMEALRLDTHAQRPRLRAFYERHGFVAVSEKVFKGDRHTAYYLYTFPDTIRNTFIYGTGNPAKLQFMRDRLKPLGIEIVGINEIGITIPDVYETGKTPLENARIKAMSYYASLKRPVFACDSGLYIEGLPEDEQPGVHVRRVGGRSLDDDEMIAHYAEIARRLGGKAVARYKNAICLKIGKNEAFEYFGDEISGEAFYLVDKPHPKRIEGFPLDSLSIHIETGKYYFMLDRDRDAGMVFRGFQEFFRNVLAAMNAEKICTSNICPTRRLLQ